MNGSWSLKKNIGFFGQIILISTLFLPIIALVLFGRHASGLVFQLSIPIWVFLYLIFLFVFGWTWSRRIHRLVVKECGQIDIFTNNKRIRLDLIKPHKLSFAIKEFVGIAHGFILPPRLSAIVKLEQFEMSVSFEIGTSFHGDTFINNVGWARITESKDKISKHVTPLKKKITGLKNFSKGIRIANPQFKVISNLEDNIDLLSFMDSFS